MSKAAKLPYSDEQLVDIAITVIKGTHDFEQGLSKWVLKAEIDKTYRNLKQHFNNELDHLQDIRGDDMLQSSTFHANMMQTDMAATVQSIRDDILHAIAEDKENQPPSQPTEVANAATVDVLTKLVSTVDNLAARLEKMENNNDNKRKTYTDDQPFWKRPNCPFKYCHTCGSNRDHDSPACPKKKEGHIDTATFENRQGGSDRYIPKKYR